MRVYLAIILSIIVHILLVLCMTLFPSRPEMKRADVTEVDLITPPPATNKTPKKEQQVVRQAFTPEQLKRQEDETLARFLSEQKQRVKKETQAAVNGMTKNSDNGKKSPQAEMNKINSAPTAKTSTKNENTGAEKRDLAKEGFREWQPEGAAGMRSPSRSGNGPSTIGESLPTDISVGSFTALNTDRYTYYTFYARIEEMVRYRWESRVEQAISSFDRETALAMGNKGWNTYVEFLLTPDGKLSSALIMKESGVKKFDAAAVNAFRDAAMFPNPPHELVQEDGFIHLQYNFTVSYATGPMGR